MYEARAVGIAAFEHGSFHLVCHPKSVLAQELPLGLISTVRD